MRKLILIRIVHSPADLGSVKEELVRESIAKLGERRWKENQRRIEKFWDDVEKEIDALSLNYGKVRVYQDGLPCGGELGLKIVNETAEKGSRNYQIVKKLVEKGATIEATESPELVRKEYELIKAFANASTEDERATAKRRYDEVKDGLLEKRDEYIAQRISDTLKAGEIGILFLGAAHSVIPKLPKDIIIKSLD